MSSTAGAEEDTRPHHDEDTREDGSVYDGDDTFMTAREHAHNNQSPNRSRSQSPIEAGNGWDAHGRGEDEDQYLGGQGRNRNRNQDHNQEPEPEQEQDLYSYQHQEPGHGETPDSELDHLPDFGLGQDRASPDVISPGLNSPTESGSIPDDTPSVQGSQTSLPLRPGLSPRASLPRTPSGALQPFERRFSSRFSPSPSSPSPSRAASPALLGRPSHSRHSSISSHLLLFQDGDTADTPQAPWDVVRWTKLKKITTQAFSEMGKRNFGSPTCLAVSSTIVIGTTKGLVLIFDYQQVLKSIIGQGTKAVESGAITSLAIAADHTTIAGGHASGDIFTWELARPAKPFLHIAPVTRGDGQNPDGHMPTRAILHIGFLGTRHTALVSADDGGMAFSHLASRGLGPVTRTVKTTRLLGRYPALDFREESKRKPSSVLAFAPLPLGNIEQATDDMGLTALLTPYLLVVVSTTPIAQTQHKSSRPKDLSPHGAMSGCLAWFPAVKLKQSKAGKDSSDTKLVYCWSNVLTVLDVKIRPDTTGAKDKPPFLFFQDRSRWSSEEAIVAVQWLSRSVVGVLTISQQLIIIEDGSAGLRVMEHVDLLQRHIYHKDFFSRQLHPVVEQSDTEHSEMHGVVADAFFQSFRVYKGRIFLLGASDVQIGIVSNWADRLTALLEHGDHVAAIRLARLYYLGEVGGVTVGLPENSSARHELVGERLLELMTASVHYTFADVHSEQPLRNLVSECFDACVTMDEQSFLFDDIYEPFKDNGQEEVFLDILESYIMDDEVTSLPPPVVKDLVDLHVAKDQIPHLEDLLCRLDPRSFDLDQVTTLCKKHYLYDALIFVWNQALHDFVTPLVDLLTLVRDLLRSANDEDERNELAMESAMKVFSYLAFALTGRKYPRGDGYDDDEADAHKSSIYKYLFAHQPVPWPTPSSPPLRTRTNDQDEPVFPYLRLLLEFDASSFMSMMSEAFEDSFLNAEDSSGAITNGSGVRVTREYIVSILLDVMSDSVFEPEQTIYLDMFIARNLPKYPQFMTLSGSSLQKVLDRLCSFRSEDLTHDCQLSVEYLLSVYHPPVTSDLVEQLRGAHFWRVLKSLYRAEHRSLDLIRTYFEDPEDKQDVFSDLKYCLQTETAPKQAAELRAVLYQNAEQLTAIDTQGTAHALFQCAPDTLKPFVEAVSDSYTRFIFLRTLLEPSELHAPGTVPVTEAAPPGELVSQFAEQYVQSMCTHDPRHVSDYVSLLPTSSLHLDAVLPAMEANGVIDAAVLLLANDGMAHDAISRLCAHLQTLQTALSGLIAAAADAPDMQSTEETATDLVSAVDKYARLGIWLCTGQTKQLLPHRRPRPRMNPSWEPSESDLELDELLWLNLIDAVVALSKSVTAASADLPVHNGTASAPMVLDVDRINNALRASVQSTFTALLTATSANPSTLSSSSSSSALAPPTARPRHRSTSTPHRPPNHHPPNPSFLLIFRAFLARASRSYAPTLSDLRAALLDIFAAYTHEQTLLHLATALLSRAVFSDISADAARRAAGWRPRSQVCDECKRRAWGRGVSSSASGFLLSPASSSGTASPSPNEPPHEHAPAIPDPAPASESFWTEFTHREFERRLSRRARAAAREASALDSEGLRANKGKEPSAPAPLEERSCAQKEVRERGTLVVFACRHVFHRGCLVRGWEVRRRRVRGGIGAGAGAGTGTGTGIGGGGGGAVGPTGRAAAAAPGGDSEDDEEVGYRCLVCEHVRV